MNLSALGRQQLEQFVALMYAAAGVPAGGEFAVQPRMLQTLHEKIVEDGHWFLALINVLNVQEITGEKVFMGINGLTSSRTDTSKDDNERVPRNLSDLDNSRYMLHPTESDIALGYNQIDSWKHFENFADMYRKAYRMAIANDRLRVGWHGVKAAKHSDPKANPNGEDLNIGWLQQLRDYKEGAQHDSGIAIGKGQEVKNLDQLVSSMKHEMIKPEFRNAPGMVVLVSSDLIGDAEGKYYESQGDTPSEKVHLNNGRILQTYGGLQAYVPPFMPDGCVKVTSLNNLSIYTQEDSWRRTMKDKPEKNQYQDFNSRNEGYVVEQEEAAAFVEGITFADAEETV